MLGTAGRTAAGTCQHANSPLADDTESKQTHLGGVIVRDLSCVVSNYRSTQSLDEYLKEQVSGF